MLKYVPKRAHILKHKIVPFNIGITYLLWQSVQTHALHSRTGKTRGGNQMSKQHAPVRLDVQHGSCQAESELAALNDDC